jgi:hypothetical protein
MRIRNRVGGMNHMLTHNKMVQPDKGKKEEELARN